ncbi:MAG TPA: ester cyclase [Polyangiaceae bacterium]|jgi:steroid delta-isomerase-like uncharacterized protein|nr:ester cyclase [Polyangiaceae bacterium]
MNQERNKATVRRYYEKLWSQGQLELADEIFAPEYENHDPATPGGVLRGVAAFKALVTTYREAFAGLKMDILEQYAEGDVVVSRWTAQGTHQGALMGLPPTGKYASEIEGVTISRFAGERIVQDRAVWDLAGLLRKLGALPG